jgi:hypothetical protein
MTTSAQMTGHKVMPASKVPEPPSSGVPGELPQATERNPSQRGMNAPAVPPGHAASGMNGTGNGPGVPRYPLGGGRR